MVYGVACLGTEDMVDFYKEYKGKRLGRFGLLSGCYHGKDQYGNVMCAFLLEGTWLSYLFTKLKLRNVALVFKNR